MEKPDLAAAFDIHFSFNSVLQHTEAQNVSTIHSYSFARYLTNSHPVAYR